MTLPVFIGIIVAVSVACFGAVVYLCSVAPVWDQEEENVSGSFYVKPLGGDHE